MENVILKYTFFQELKKNLVSSISYDNILTEFKALHK